MKHMPCMTIAQPLVACAARPTDDDSMATLTKLEQNEAAHGTPTTTSANGHR